MNKFDNFDIFYWSLSFVPLHFPYISCTMGAKEVDTMFQRKRYLYLSETEYSILVKSLVQLKNKLIQQNRFTDCVDELLLKIISAPNIRI